MPPSRQTGILRRILILAAHVSIPARRRSSVLRHADFLRFLSARLLATLAAQMQIVAVGWQIYAITRDPLDLGLIGLSQFLPFVLLDLAGGPHRRSSRSSPHRDAVLRNVETDLRARCCCCSRSAASSRVAGVRRDDVARLRARIFDAERSGVVAESRAARETSRAPLPQLVRVSDRDRAGPGARRVLYLAGPASFTRAWRRSRRSRCRY